MSGESGLIGENLHATAAETGAERPMEHAPEAMTDKANRREAGAVGASASGRTSGKIRLADGSESDCRAGILLAREANQRTIFRDIPFSEAKARTIFDKAVRQPERCGLIYAVPGADTPLAEDGLLGFASVHAGEHFLGEGTLISTVQTLNISQRLTGTLLGGKVALRLVQAVRYWAKTRSCAHLMVHVTNGVDAQEADEFFRRCGMATVGGK